MERFEYSMLDHYMIVTLHTYLGESLLDRSALDPIALNPF